MSRNSGSTSGADHPAPYLNDPAPAPGSDRTIRTATASGPLALSPPEMARLAEETGVAKSGMDLWKLLMLAILAGAFIALGAVFSTLVTAGSTMGFGMTKMAGGIAFSLGLILVVVGGAELFTGNNLLVMAWAGGKIRTRQVLVNWLTVYTGNMIGALSMVILIWFSGYHLSGEGIVAGHMLQIAHDKCSLDFTEALTRGILCNMLVCLAIWLCLSARTTQGRILAILFPITAFVAAGFEHSVANMYFIPAGIVLKEFGGNGLWQLVSASPAEFGNLSWQGFFVANLIPVTLGNMIGGGAFVGLAYWFIYLKR